MAERISKQTKIKATSEALTSQLVDLIRLINDPLIMAANLVSKKIIDRSILERVILPSSTQSEKACEVLTAVSDAVMINPDYFATFCDILDSEPVTKDVARILQGTMQVVTKLLFCRDHTVEIIPYFFEIRPPSNKAPPAHFSHIAPYKLFCIHYSLKNVIIENGASFGRRSTVVW